ncbi:hypothetical protein CPC08DRAFT_708688 [Agrocybe pediades]|nr:hypothetical protein CPC08DRAFT_708688 [Agrocybe pediades]
MKGYDHECLISNGVGALSLKSKAKKITWYENGEWRTSTTGWHECPSAAAGPS